MYQNQFTFLITSDYTKNGYSGTKHTGFYYSAQNIFRAGNMKKGIYRDLSKKGMKCKINYTPFDL